MRHKLSLLWSWFVWLTTLALPDVPCVRRLRGRLYGFLMKRCGRNFQVGFNVTIRGLENFSVGDDVYIAPGSIILAGHDISLGDGVQLAFYTVLTDGGHTLKDSSYRFGAREQRPVRIEAGTWLGAHVTVVPGVTIGRSVVIGANSVVTRDIPDSVLAAGVPAVVVRKNDTA
jgi:acetyltransferase-like isoleucine patch superfamily enzyme